jgi:uncharacterized protein (TIGR02186 family)
MTGRGILLAAALAAASPVASEELAVLMSTQDVSISSNYTGARVALFGSIERDAGTVARSGRYDIAVTIAGPASPIVVRNKERFGPIWVNQNQRRYQGLPGYFAVLSTAPIETVANEETRRRRRLGLAYYFPDLPSGGEARESEAAARDAVDRLRAIAGMNAVVERGVTMPRPNLYLAHIELPASAPTGRYSVSVNLLSEGVLLRTAETSFVVRKIGFEAFLAASARDHGLIYGIAAAVLAGFFGFLGNLIFRKD